MWHIKLLLGHIPGRTDSDKPETSRAGIVYRLTYLTVLTVLALFVVPRTGYSCVKYENMQLYKVSKHTTGFTVTYKQAPWESGGTLKVFIEVPPSPAWAAEKNEKCPPPNAFNIGICNYELYYRECVDPDGKVIGPFQGSRIPTGGGGSSTGGGEDVSGPDGDIEEPVSEDDMVGGVGGLSPPPDGDFSDVVIHWGGYRPGPPKTVPITIGDKVYRAMIDDGPFVMGHIRCKPYQIKVKDKTITALEGEPCPEDDGNTGSFSGGAENDPTSDWGSHGMARREGESVQDCIDRLWKMWNRTHPKPVGSVEGNPPLSLQRKWKHLCGG